MKLIEVKDQPGLGRDPQSGAIICTDKSLINKRKEIKRLRKAQTDKVDDLAQQVESLHDEISDLKQLLIQLVEKNNG
jgi:TolA-binding protein